MVEQRQEALCLRGYISLYLRPFDQRLPSSLIVIMALASPTFYIPPVNEVNGLKSLNALNNHFPDLNTISDNQKDLVVSPYTESSHRLRLDTVDIQSSLLARALTALKPLRHDYATAPYLESFNWQEIISNLSTLVQSSGLSWKRQRFFVVVFCSQIPPSTNYADLGALDKAAHAEATASGGFLK